MEEKLSEENDQTLSVHKEEDEEMEVTMTTHLEHLPDGVDADPSTQTHPEDTGDAQMHPTAATLSSGAVCKTEDSDDDDGSDSEDSDSDSSSSSSSSSSSCSTSSPSVPLLGEDDDDEGFSQPGPIKTRDEVLIEELPAVEEVSVSLPEDAELQPVGTVSSIIQQLVVIQSLKDTPPLTDDSIIFKSDRVPLGKVFEVFGPVSSPLYILRFNSADQISSKGLAIGLTVYYAPTIKEYTSYILTQHLKLSKGSDASWKNDQEPPVEALDYSDDEKEQEAKRKLKKEKKKRDNTTDNPALPLQQRDARVFPPRHAGPPFRHQNHRVKHQPFKHTDIPPRYTHPPPIHTNIPPMYLPPPCPYPPPPPHPFPPPNFPLYPPPPPSFFNPSFSPHLWPPNSVPFSEIPPPPPPPPPPQ